MIINENDQNILDWNDSISLDSKEFVVLEDGDYDFTVKEFERGSFPGGAKIPPCNKASLVLQVESTNGSATIHTDLLLHRSLEWKLSEFFRCIGQKKRGERIVMDWSKIVGSKGRARIRKTTYTDRDGNSRNKNEVERFIDADELPF